MAAGSKDSLSYQTTVASPKTSYEPVLALLDEPKRSMRYFSTWS